MYVRIWHGEQMSLQTLAKGVQWWRWCDLRWQTVPDLGTSNKKISVANGGPVGLWLDETASVGGAKSSSTRYATRTNGPRYDGAQPWRTSYVSTAILNWMRCGMRSQCRLISASDTWSVSVLTRDYKMVCYLQRIFNRYRKFKQEVSKLSVLKLDVCSKSMHATFSFAFFSRYAEAGTSNFR